MNRQPLGSNDGCIVVLSQPAPPFRQIMFLDFSAEVASRCRPELRCLWPPKYQNRLPSFGGFLLEVVFLLNVSLLNTHDAFVVAVWFLYCCCMCLEGRSVAAAQLPKGEFYEAFRGMCETGSDLFLPRASSFESLLLLPRSFVS